MRLDPDTLASYYDWEHDDYLADVELYLRLAAERGDPVLEAACGSGRVALALAQAGHRVVGFDRDRAMLRRARHKLELLGPAGARCWLFQADLCRWQLDERFALAILALDGLGYLLEPARQREALALLARHLRPDGELVIDCTNHQIRDLGADDHLLIHHRTAPYGAERATLTKWVARSYDLAGQRQHLALFYDLCGADGVVRRGTAELTLRYFSRYELLWLLRAAGLEEVALYGDYDESPFIEGSERIVVRARRGRGG